MPIFKINGFRRARLAKEMTQVQAGRAIGVDPITIIQWEKGAGVPKKHNLEKAAEVYGVTVDELIKEGDDDNCGDG